MELTTYQPPLRGAVLFAVGLNRGAFSVETLAEFAGVPVVRAKAYLSILVACKALKETKQGFARGPEWEFWSETSVRTRPKRGGEAQAAASMDAMRRNIATRFKEEIARRGWSLCEVERRSGVPRPYMIRLMKRCMPPPACHLVMLARCFETTVEGLIAPMPQLAVSTAYFKR